MQLLTAILMVCFVISCSCVQGEVESTKKVVRLQWYIHDTPFSGPNSSAVSVIGYNASDIQNELAHYLFGQIFVFDDPLTQGPSLSSPSLGRGRGTYTFISKEEFLIYMSFTISFQTGEYNGSSLNIVGGDPKQRVFSIVGGTGKFILARGILEQVLVKPFGPFHASSILSHNATIHLN
ncbi:hypothetical protein O6H91_11G076200 [Diphasiastrum complanatum]|uniref:Uncharacterized protein n=1 Tax=Diphasiastrum complanatum TaxID=34168 RepID=A0ACC2CAV0_DIPCM|nr:hypothetical protein O6H91_Y536000 [Diphasiastrum complanatum]KAJ7539075.1 hypothetical protein O6H91_11G076200 [Diphasiastrum complanatum]